MARPKSEDKRSAILEAAILLFAARGAWSTPTSAISRAADVAEGTLFTYFATKEALLNELYRELKQELAGVLLSTFPETADVRTQFKHIWDHYVRWGVEHPERLKVLTQLGLSDQITAASREVGNAPFAKLERLATESIVRGELRNYSMEFVGALLIAAAETTMTFVATNRGQPDYAAEGFEIFWRGISR